LLLYLLFAVDCCIIIIFYPRQSLFSEHTRIQHITRLKLNRPDSNCSKWHFIQLLRLSDSFHVVLF